MIQAPPMRSWVRNASRWPLRIIAGVFALSLTTVMHGTLTPNVSRSNPTDAPKPTHVEPAPIPKNRPLPVIKPMPKPLTRPPRVYHIQWGDSLWAISNKFHVSIQELEELNHLTSTTIYAGQTLLIPQTYVVKPHDTLNTIARQFKVSLVALWHENRLLTDKLQPGQTLVIPYTGQAVASYQAPAAPLASPTSPSLPYSREDFRLLAHLVHAEAGNQPFIGQVAVAAVVLNRLKTPGFPKTIPQVIEEPGQFESVSNGTIWSPANSIAYLAVSAALKGWDPTHGALFYYNPSLPYDNWMNSLPITAVIGDQVFCR